MYKLILQVPKPKVTHENGFLSVHKKNALFFDMGQRIIAELENPEIIRATCEGILLKGYEPNGATRDGTRKFKYQEWYLPYTNKVELK